MILNHIQSINENEVANSKCAKMESSCDFFVSSVAEISSTGFPYNKLGKVWSDGTRASALLLAEEYSKFYQEQQGDFKSYTFSVIQTAYLKSIALFAELTYKSSPLLHFEDSITRDAVKKMQQYDRLGVGYFYDMKEFYNWLIEENKLESLKSDFESLWNKLVIYESHSEKILGTLEIKNSCGLSVYIPHNYSKRKTIHQSYLNLKWYEETYSNQFWNLP